MKLDLASDRCGDKNIIMSEIALIGKKLGMTREFYRTGQIIPVTVLKMEKARIIQIIDEQKEDIKRSN